MKDSLIMTTEQVKFIQHQATSLFDRACECANNRQGVAAVMLSVASIEAIFHDLTEWFKTAVEYKSIYKNSSQEDQNIFGVRRFVFNASQLNMITKTEIELFEELNLLENKRKQLMDKVEALFRFAGVKPPKGNLPWQEFNRLQEIRNATIHIKGITLTQDKNPKGKIVGYPDFFTYLEKNKLITIPEDLNKKAGWMEVIEKDVRFINWCMVSTVNFANLIYECLPGSYMSEAYKKETRWGFQAPKILPAVNK